MDACFASDLTRTSLTAGRCMFPRSAPCIGIPAFSGNRLGRWEDLPFGYLERFESEDITCFRKDPVSWHIEGGERFAEYTGRFIRGMQAAAARFPGKTIAIFCHSCRSAGSAHGAVFSAGMPARFPTVTIRRCPKLLWDGQTFTYEFLNDSSHLPEGLSAHREPGKSRNLWYRPLEGTLPQGLPQPPEYSRSFLAILDGMG